MFIELHKNGKKLCVAGHKEQGTLELRILHDNRFSEALLLVDGEPSGKDVTHQKVEWVNEFVRPGDAVTIKLLKEAEPDKPNVGARAKETTPGTDKVYCSFCGRPENEVPRLIAGKGVFICSECVDVCRGTLEKGDT